MPNSHRHLHRHRDILGDIEDIINGVNPDDDESHQRQSVKEQSNNNAERDRSTVVQVVYKTMKPTFSGSIGGYVTIHSTPPAKETPKPEPIPSKQPEVKETPTPKDPPKESPKPTPKETPKETPAPKEPPKPTPTPTPSQEDKAPSPTPKESSAVPSAIRPPQQSTSDADDDLAKATGSPTHASSPTKVAVDGNRAHSSSATPTLDSAAASSPSSVSEAGSGSGTSAGAKAGIALGVLGGVLVLGLLIFFLVGRRRKQAEREQLPEDNEKAQAAPPPAASVQQQPMAAPEPQPVARAVTPEISPAPSPEPVEEMVRTNPIAPRISLRPASQFGWDLEKQAAKGAEAAAAVGVAVTGNAADRPDTSQSNNPANPFGQQAERVPSPVPDQPAVRPTYIPYSPSVASVSDKAPAPEASNAGEAAVATAAVATTAAVVAAGAATLTRKTSMRNQNAKNAVDLTVTTTNLDATPPSPVGTDYSASSASPVPGAAPSPGAAAIAAAGGPANSTVHRVQLDFKPTLEDELELKAGDLVRLLHEYDDGWALVIRLDRSRQGVAPRTCLSTRPVKPRPPQGRPPVQQAGGPPRGTNSPTGQRPMTPQGQRPMTPQGMRGPNGSPMGAPRMGPGPGSRPASPAGPMMKANAGRPQSPMGRPMSPGPKFQGPPTSRPQSPSGMSQRGSPAVSSPLNPNPNPNPPSPTSSPTESASVPPAGPIGRKPVPGQAY
ncbi:hypothetical protein J3F83DRAFT_52757 [Trichoderma novae-zelandiae]